VREVGPPFGMVRELYESHVKRHRVRNEIWFDRPCFWWPDLRKDDGLTKLFSPQKWIEAVFCEDTSDFEDPGEGQRTSPHEFVAEFEGPWERRHVLMLGGFSYSPRSRFAI
jgi:hypothetical protein